MGDPGISEPLPFGSFKTGTSPDFPAEETAAGLPEGMPESPSQTPPGFLPEEASFSMEQEPPPLPEPPEVLVEGPLCFKHSSLKQLTGGDALTGRIKHKQKANELPAIFNWAINCEEEEARRFLTDTAKHVPSLRQEMEDAQFTLNPLREWVEQELEKGTGSLVGFRKFGSKAKSENKIRDTLYPAYEFWCEKRKITPHNHRTFTESLLHCLNTLV